VFYFVFRVLFVIVDCHVHIGFYGRTRNPLRDWGRVCLSALLDYLRERGVSRAVLLPCEGYERVYAGYGAFTEDVLCLQNFFPELFTAFCSIDPRDPNLGRKLRYYSELCYGFGEHKVGLPVDHYFNCRLYGLCGKYELPVLIHMDDYYNWDEIGLRGLERVVKKYSNTVFILHGPAWWREISRSVERTDYPSGCIVEEGRVQYLLREYDNVYADLSAFSGYNALARDLNYAKRFLIEFSHKLAYGSDLLDFFSPSKSLIGLLRSLNLPEFVYRRIFYGNIMGIVKK